MIIACFGAVANRDQLTGFGESADVNGVERGAENTRPWRIASAWASSAVKTGNCGEQFS